jgi:succinyl-diaminopimelate desuccinylase
VGVGGGTVAAFLRRAGHPVVAWSTLQGLAHQPNEYALISSTMKDAQVMTLVLFDAA